MPHEMGTYSLDIKPPKGAVMHDHGKFIVIWKRDPQAGWQLYRDIWNTDVPAPTH
jgi:ketosteroid isomerase-like protein